MKKLIASCLTLMALTVWPTAANSATMLYSRGTDTAVRLLASHNSERARLNLPPLQWDPQLAASAAAYGPMLARVGRLQHSPRAMRPGQRENLWMGTRGSYSPEQMVRTWIDERRMFRAGMFPYVSRTGNWNDVSHYTQLIWKGTTRVGCVIHSTGSWDYLICRYSPPGNVDGRYVG
ncbi:CAP domain-containing protein [Sphingomonas sp.]|uniref:CAP domain-containing protein n=1 Tax=Sphingomonas sp. TaxID=28214 RepID=UPI0025DA29D0|nr:CAP domain-containing protein [Sphingomonas sp.]